MSVPAARLELSQISKRYPGVVANDAVSLSVQPGQLHALIGENGAGKSTLMKIAYGVTQPDAGEIRWQGERVVLNSPAQARRLGIGMVFQHFSLFESLSVAENIALALPPGVIDATRLAGEIEKLGERYGLPIKPDQPVYALSVGERQRVEVIRCLMQQPKLLIMDEPTSVLAPQAVERLFETLRRLAAEGVSVLYISHKLDEVRALCSAATVMRGGKVTGVCDPRVESVASLSKLMIGTEPPRSHARVHQAGAPVLDVRDLSIAPREPSGKPLNRISLTVHAGEIVGIAGVSGNGQSELLDLIAGEDRRAPNDAILIHAQPVGAEPVTRRRALGLAFVPEQRLGRAAVPGLSLADNLLLAGQPEALSRYGMLLRKAMRGGAQAIIDRFGVKAAGPDAPARSLSGGNLQKFIVGRALAAQPSLLVIAQPTWGVDVGAAAQIRQRIVDLRDAGAAVLVVSEELDELFEISDVLMVMAAGRLSEPIPIARATIERIGALMGEQRGSATGALAQPSVAAAPSGDASSTMRGAGQ